MGTAADRSRLPGFAGLESRALDHRRPTPLQRRESSEKRSPVAKRSRASHIIYRPFFDSRPDQFLDAPFSVPTALLTSTL
jgi:hypothetical protein